MVRNTRLPADRRRRVLGGRIAEIEPVDPFAVPLAAEHDVRPIGSPPRRRASSISKNGTTSVAPAARAWQIVDVARNRSITTTVLPASCSGCNFPRQIVDSKLWHVNQPAGLLRLNSGEYCSIGIHANRARRKRRGHNDDLDRATSDH